MPATNPTPNTDKTVADILIHQGLLTPAQIASVRVETTNNGRDLDTLIQERGLVTDDVFYAARAKLIGVPFISISTIPFSPEALSFVPKNVAERIVAIPFAYNKEDNSLSIVMADPLDLEGVNFLAQKTGLTVNTFQGIPAEIKAAIEAQYSQGLASDVKAALKENEEISTVKTFEKSDIEKTENIKDAPIAKIISTILEYAVKSRASDIHIEPQEDRVRVRYRIDGILYERLSLPKAVQSAVISRIKILSDLKIDEHRLPQDGRFNFKYSDQEVDVRVSVLPTVFGEKVVLRLLRKTGGIPTLQELGFGGTQLRTLEVAVARPHGIIIVCGPTGSGKTTTLYAILTKLNTAKVNIATLEDPVEYQITGINQVQINPEIGLTFASGLRAFLRQDPNIILVGEIRDAETTEQGIQAALTGHLVFSTLHTSSAAGALPRLIEMGAETYLLASTMNAAIGQRIARRICPYCKKEYQVAPEVAQEVQQTLGKLLPQSGIKLYKGEGCEQCGNTGYLGRVGIFEVMNVSEKIAALILQKADSGTIERQAVSEGMVTMMQDGFLKALAGVTTIDEVLRVAQE